MNYEQANNILQAKQQAEAKKQQDYNRSPGILGGMEQEIKATQVSPLHEAIKQLERDIELIGQAYGQLHCRLEPITAQVPNNATEKGCPPSYGVSNVVQALQSQSERLQHIATAIHRQIDCLEV